MIIIKKYIIYVLTLIFVMLVNNNVFATIPKYAEPFALPGLTGNMRRDYINVLYSQLGYNEAGDNSTVFGAWAGDPYQKWCSEFAAWCAEKAEIPLTIFPKEKSGAGYRDFFVLRKEYFNLKEGVNPNVSNFTNEYPEVTTISIYDAVEGDILLQETNGDYTDGPDHTAIFIENTPDGVKTISGNVSNKVKIKIINAKDIHGICKPDYEMKNKVKNPDFNTSDWAKSEVIAAYNKRLIPKRMLDDNLKKEIKRAEYAALAVNFYMVVSDNYRFDNQNPFDDILEVSYTDDIIKAYNLGIVNGISNNEFNPNGKITREQAATMLMRTADVLGYDTSYRKTVESGVSSWAKAGVGFVTQNGIMNGTGNGFEPHGKYTKEQAIITFARMYDNLK